MAAGTYDVLLRPFREVVKLGQLGQARAQLDPDHENNTALRIAARSLSNEGERALKKITPLLLHPTAEFSEFLLDLALHQDDVTIKFRDIDILLYDFEDFVDLDSFEKDKFDSLHGAIKGVAIVLLDRIRRRAAESSLVEQIPQIASIPLSRQPNASNTDRSVTPQTTRRMTSRSRTTPTQIPQKPLPEPPKRTSGPYESQSRNEAPIANTSAARHVPRQVTSSSTVGKASAPERSWYAGDEAQHLATYGHQSRPQTSNAETLRRSMEQLEIRTDIVARQRPLSPDSLPSTHPSVSSSTFSPLHYRSSATISIPENDLPHDDGEWGPVLTKQGYAMATGSIAGSLGQLTERRNDNTFQPAPGYHGRARQDSLNGYGTAAPATFDECQLVRGGHEPVSPLSDSGNTFGGGSVSRVSSIRASGSSGSKTDSVGRISVRSSTKAGSVSSGSLGPESSFGINKGFCRGAQRFLAEGPGSAVKKVGGQGPSPGLGANTKEYTPEFHSMFSTPIGYTDPMAQCSQCEYKAIYSQLLQDMQQDPLANQVAHGIRYRLRFLFKSHIVTRDLDNVYFACRFCSQAGATCRDWDATVFQSVHLLFRHLARHPLPLPDVPGVTVLYDNLAPNHPGAQDYDLHIPNPIANLGVVPALDEIENETLHASPLPTARASKDHIQRRNEKPLARPGPVDPALNSLEVLQFLAGAKITRVDFPERWEGKWCRGWHDGVYGVFPSKLVDLELPRGLDMSSFPKSGRSAVTKWKWEAKTSSSSLWLKLGKGEKVSSIAWDDPKAWYWVGKNNQGKTGIFPKSHIKVESMRDGLQDEAFPKAGSKNQSGFSSFFGRKG